MTSRSNSWIPQASASQPISSPSACSSPGPCSDCGQPSGAACPACEDAFCAGHLYRCPDCDSHFCAACLAGHCAEGHWSDSDTTAELTRSHTVPLSQRSCDDPPHRIPEISPLPDLCDHSPLSHRIPETSPLPHLCDPPPLHCLADAPLPPSLLTTSIAALLQRLRSHLQTQSESRNQSLVPLHACVYIQIFCARCGYMRQALAELPQQSTASCPGCARPRLFAVLAIGFTSRALPFHERLFLTGHAAHRHPWERLASRDRQPRRRRKPPAHALDAETRDYLQRHLARFRDIAGSLLRQLT